LSHWNVVRLGGVASLPFVGLADVEQEGPGRECLTRFGDVDLWDSILLDH
jgi:hypothetical protein